VYNFQACALRSVLLPPAEVCVLLKGGFFTPLREGSIRKNASALVGNDFQQTEGKILDCTSLEEFVKNLGKELFRLEKPLVVKIYLPRPNQEAIRAFCSATDIGCSGIRIGLPSRLNLSPGVTLDLEIFPSNHQKSIPVKGIVSKITRDLCGSVPRCLIEIRFGPLEDETLRSIAEYVRTQLLATGRLCA